MAFAYLCLMLGGAEMMGVARPWSPPVPEDPENVRTTFLGGSGRGTTASYASQRPSDSLDTPSQSVYQLPIVNASQYPPSSFSHVPPGSVRMSAYAASTESLSEGRGWSEKRPGGIGSSESRHSPTTEGDELLVPSEEVSSGHQRNHSHPRFVRHEDGGLMESASEGVPHQEVVDLPPLCESTVASLLLVFTIGSDALTLTNTYQTKTLDEVEPLLSLERKRL